MADSFDNDALGATEPAIDTLQAARDRALDEALEESFPASDPVASTRRA